MRIQTDPRTFLRRALLIDAGISGGFGILLAAGAGVLAGVLGLPVALLRWAGIVLVPFAAFLAYQAAQPRISEPAVYGVAGCNALWVAASIALLASADPTPLGFVFVLAQAAAVAAFAYLEYAGMRRVQTLQAG